jgi:predicted nucleotidyltransferase
MFANKSAMIEAIIAVAQALGTFNDKVVFVGGAVAWLYADDPGAPEMRPTKDIDIVVEVASALELEDIRQQLARCGFQHAMDEKVICRYHYGEILVDVMATRNIGWAPANPWFKSGFDRAEIRYLHDQAIKVMPFPYYLATKLAAFKDRGKDPRTSYDFEDIVFMLDNRITLVNDILESEREVREFLVNELMAMLSDELLQEALLAHLELSMQTSRFERLKQKIALLKT